jgi:hypothetical protein
VLGVVAEVLGDVATVGSDEDEDEEEEEEEAEEKDVPWLNVGKSVFASNLSEKSIFYPGSLTLKMSFGFFRQHCSRKAHGQHCDNFRSAVQGQFGLEIYRLA